MLRILRHLLALTAVVCLCGAAEIAHAQWQDGAYPQVSKKRRFTPPAEPGPLGDHPRLWLTPERLKNIRSKACVDAVGNPIPGCTRDKHLATFMDYRVPSDYWGKKAWHNALAYVISGYRHHAHNAIAAMDTTVAAITNTDRGQSNFLNIASNLRDTALVFDWCYDVLKPNQRTRYIAYMNQLMQELWNPFDNPTHTWDGWAVDDPGNNFYYSFLLATTYAALAMYGENPESPSLPFQGTEYTDMLEFVLAKIDQESIPQYLSTWGRGGAWHEGNNYGLLSKRYLLEAFIVLRDVGVRNYFEESSFPAEAARYHLYSVQPGYQRVYPGGDLPRKSGPNDRALMLLVTDGLNGSVESEMAQYFVNNVKTAEPWNQWQFLEPFDVLLYDPDYPQTDFAALPLAYFAEGGDWMNSRSSWADDAVSVSFVCTNRIQGHQAQDQNAFVIYKDGFQATHGNLYSNWGIYQSTDAYNTILINGVGQAYGGDWDHPTQTVRDIGNVTRFESGPGYAYIVGDASDAYYTNAGQFGYGDERLLDVFTRQLLHILPGWVVVFDRIVPRDPTHLPTWLLQTREHPVRSGNRITATDGALLHEWMLLPEDPVVRIGPHPGGVSYGSPDSIACWRTEIEPGAPGEQHVFLNVLLATDAGDPRVPLVTRLQAQSGNMVGARIVDGDITQVAMFGTDASPVRNVLYNAGFGPAGTHLVFGLEPDADYALDVSATASGVVVRIDRVPPGTGVRSSAQGSLRFDVEGHFERRKPVREPSAPHSAPRAALPGFDLLQNHPNPFNPTTTIGFSLPQAANVTLSVYDATGALVKTLVHDYLSAGPGEARWNGRDEEGRAVSSGVYFYNLRAGSRTMTRKMLLLK